MKNNIKNGIMALFGGLGLIALLLGVFTSVYPFNTGLIIAISIWIITGIVSAFAGIKRN